MRDPEIDKRRYEFGAGNELAECPECVCPEMWKKPDGRYKWGYRWIRPNCEQ